MSVWKQSIKNQLIYSYLIPIFLQLPICYLQASEEDKIIQCENQGKYLKNQNWIVACVHPVYSNKKIAMFWIA